MLVSIQYSPVYSYPEILQIYKTNKKLLLPRADPEPWLTVATVSWETGQFIMLSLTCNCTKWDWLTSSHVESRFYILHYSFEKVSLLSALAGINNHILPVGIVIIIIIILSTAKPAALFWIQKVEHLSTVPSYCFQLSSLLNDVRLSEPVSWGSVMLICLKCHAALWPIKYSLLEDCRNFLVNSWVILICFHLTIAFWHQQLNYHETLAWDSQDLCFVCRRELWLK